MLAYCHKKPISIVMDAKRSQMPFANEMVTLSKGKRLDKNDYRQQISVILEIIEEVK